MTRRRIFGILSIAWMIVIFAFSSRTGVQSTSDSVKTTQFLDSIVGSGNYIYDYAIDFLIRKAAHMGEYFILAVFACHYFAKNLEKDRKEYYISWLFVTIYSITDEIHQLFVPGRSGQVRDVIIDSFGAFLGVMVTFNAVRIFLGVRRRRLNEKN